MENILRGTTLEKVLIPPTARGALAAAALILSPFPAAAADKGPVQVWFAEDAATVSDKLALLCADRNATIVEQDERHVLCQREERGAKGVLAQYIYGSRGSTAPQLTIRFSILRDGKNVRVQATQWFEVQSAFGQTRRNPLDDRKQSAQLENLLIGIGGHNVPPELIEPPIAPAAPTLNAAGK